MLMEDKRAKGLTKFRQMSWRRGSTIQRTNLDPKIRQKVSLVALAAGGHEHELRIHIDIARKLGFAKEELSEALQ
jgi:alkylhydroperoxidase/carboxymuconolactone decarboxylase family protein YurZ